MKNKLTLKEKILIFLKKHESTIEEIMEMLFSPRQWLWREILGTAEYYRIKKRTLNELNYLKRRGLLRSRRKKRKTLIKLTVKGEEEINWLKKIKRPDGRWDGKWYVVIFDIPEEIKLARLNLRRKLYELGFGLLQKSVFISPYNLLSEIEKLSEENQIRKYLRFLRVDKIDEEKELIKKVWNLKEINTKYKKFIVKCKMFKNKNFKNPLQRYFAYKGLEKELSEIIKCDPFIPKEKLPLKVWYRERAEKVFKNLFLKNLSDRTKFS